MAVTGVGRQPLNIKRAVAPTPTLYTDDLNMNLTTQYPHMVKGIEDCEERAVHSSLSGAPPAEDAQSCSAELAGTRDGTKAVCPVG